MTNNALVFYLRREAYDIGDIADKTITVDKLIEELKLAKDTLGGDTKIFLGDESDNVYGKLTLMRITKEQYEVYEEE